MSISVGIFYILFIIYKKRAAKPVDLVLVYVDFWCNCGANRVEKDGNYALNGQYFPPYKGFSPSPSNSKSDANKNGPDN